MTEVKIDLLDEPDGRYRLSARIAGVTYLTDRFALLTTGLRFDYSQLLAHEAALILAARPSADSPEFEYTTRTRYERALEEFRPGAAEHTPAQLPEWMQIDAVVQVGVDQGWVKGFTDSRDEVMVYLRPNGLSLHRPEDVTHVPQPAADLLEWIEAEKADLRTQSWRGLRQRSSGVRVYRLDTEAGATAEGLVPRSDLSDPQIVDIDLWTGLGEGRTGAADYRDDLPEQHTLTLHTPDGQVHRSSFAGSSQIHARATALLLDAFPDPQSPLPAWRLRTDEDRLLEQQLRELGWDGDHPEPATGTVVRTPDQQFGRVGYLRTSELVAVIHVDQSLRLFRPDELEPYQPTEEEQAGLAELDARIRQDTRARAEREAGSIRLIDRAATPDLY
ncbi:hypothetical protein [Kineosporia babensis]|uniref:Uncharacterized protein n=1 Tax=Kineosporia babensis TaxID=499548 RepID=A0A9X1NIV8_9ACTN|nr:hypothetical protein [Kineosporia babensis]MCD5314566.1 hypothetical protein [Kineosporia babensis]